MQVSKERRGYIGEKGPNVRGDREGNELGGRHQVLLSGRTTSCFPRAFRFTGGGTENKVLGGKELLQGSREEFYLAIFGMVRGPCAGENGKA